MEPKEIIGKCWDYEFDYYDEYEKKISYISYSDEIAIDLSLETDNIFMLIHMTMMVKMRILI